MWRWLRRLLIWIGPIIVVLVMVACGFLFWVLNSQPGTRWALTTAAEQLGGEATGVSGTIWRGVYASEFSIVLPDLAIRIKDFHLEADWRELLEWRVHAHDLSAGSVVVDMTTGTETPSTEPFRMPALPVRVAIDRLAVADLRIIQDGEPLPISVMNLAGALSLTDAGGQVVLRQLDIGHAMANVRLQGEVTALSLEDPWPLKGHVKALATGTTAESPLCARQYLPTLPVKAALKSAPAADSGNSDAGSATGEPAACTLEVDGQVEGSLDALKVVLKGAGQGMSLDATANLTPRGAFPLTDARLALQLADGSTLNSHFNWDSKAVDGAMQDHLVGALRADKLDVGQLVGPAIPPAVVTTDVAFDVRLRNHSELLSAVVDASVAEGSRWNKQPLAGILSAKVVNAAQAAAPQLAGAAAASTGPTAPPAAPTGAPAAGVPATTSGSAPVWKSLQLEALKMDLRLGKNHLKADGALGIPGRDLTLDLTAPDLAAFWPDLSGGARVQGVAGGTLATHKADLSVQYTPSGSKRDIVGAAPLNAKLALDGRWGPGQTDADRAEGWRGTVRTLDLDHAGLGLHARTPTMVSFIPGAVAPAWQWQVGGTELDFLLSSKRVFTLAHQGSRGGAGRWETQGAIAQLAISPKLVRDVGKKLALDAGQEPERGGVKVSADRGNAVKEIVLALNWDLKFAGTLQGSAHVERVSGDIMVPAQPAFPLGLETFSLDVNAKAAGTATSRVTADLDVRTAKMGRIAASGSTLLHATPAGGFRLDPKDAKTAKINADIDDLGWTSLLLGDAMELGGALHADVQLESRPTGQWNSSGTITGEKIRIIRIDDGVRLLDGTLSARLDNERLIIDKLHFPARLRVEPKEWRTATWVRENADAQGGRLDLTGEWNLFESRGTFNADLYRYPILQRSDRYAMISGRLQLTAELPRIGITGSLVADAGWFDLDVLGGIPTVDSDVVVVRAGEEKKEASAPMDVTMDLEVDLGPRFYLTGYGVNSGLVGKMRITMIEGRLTGMGALRTRGGAIEAYGQRLQLRRGSITFQGDITSPVLDIEALRTGLAVEAGVRVAGTAKRPRIDLVSYPAVSEIEKLSWLLLGHGPDDSGGDVALLFSVGTSFLGSGEPFYRKFGINEVSIRSGELGSAGSVLPAESVVSALDSGTSDIERKFILVSKTLSNGITLSIQQALSDTGTVGRASYRLARGLTAELTGGTVNGLALVYRWFSRQ